LFLTGWFFLLLRFRTEPDIHIVLRAGYYALKKPFRLGNYRPWAREIAMMSLAITPVVAKKKELEMTSISPVNLRTR